MAEAIILLVAIGLIVGVFSLTTGKKSRGFDQAKFKRRWQETTNLLASGSAGQKLAVIEADKILDEAMKIKGFNGQTMSDRLKSAGNQLGSRAQINSIWDAHRLRNRLVHEESKISKQQALRALNTYKSALSRLGAM